MKYTNRDVIWKTDDARLKNAIGKACYVGDRPNEVIANANNDKGRVFLKEVCADGHRGDGFAFNVFSKNGNMDYPFIVFRKSENAKLGPFDFSLKEDREAIKGRWLERKEGGGEFLVIGFSMGCAMFAEDVVVNWGKGTSRPLGDGNELFNQFVFVDTGKPVGKEVEE